MKKYIFSLIMIIFMFAGISNAQTYKIIVNNNNGVSSLTKKEVSDLFLKKSTKWSDGRTVMPVDLNSGSKIRDDFSKEVHGKGTPAIRSFWQQAAFSGTATVPPEKANDAEVIDYVKKNAGAIGYISASSDSNGVKTIRVN